MKKKLIGVAVCAMLAFGVLGLAACAGNSEASGSDNGSSGSGDASSTSPSGQISVYSREDGSGTRGAFIELFGIEEKDASGEKVDMTTPSASITNSTSVMMTSVSGDERGIGYISLGSMNDTVKALKVDGAEATAENVKSGSYKIARPFNIATNDDVSDVAQDFIDYIMSADGQRIVEDNGYIAIEEAALPYTASGKSGKIVVAGSSSVTPVMEKLAEAYKIQNPEVTIEVQQSDSTTGMNMALDKTCDIGMASRELKDSEISGGLTPKVIAQDGIAIIVSKGASIDELSSEQVKAIYTGEVVTWEDALA